MGKIYAEFCTPYEEYCIICIHKIISKSDIFLEKKQQQIYKCFKKRYNGTAILTTSRCLRFWARAAAAAAVASALSLSSEKGFSGAQPSEKTGW